MVESAYVLLTDADVAHLAAVLNDVKTAPTVATAIVEGCVGVWRSPAPMRLYLPRETARMAGITGSG